MTPLPQELMTPQEAARWFRRSISWLRQQHDLLRLTSPHGQPLYHVRTCRAYIFGKLCGLPADALRQAQLNALAQACGLGPALATPDPRAPASQRRPASPTR